jgi:hypothetical protein
MGKKGGALDRGGAIPTRYNDILFRSKLEADWAITLDKFGIAWEYEPEGRYWGPDRVFYAPDFYLPATSQWLEVKGVEKPEDRLKWAALLADTPEEVDDARPTLLVGGPKGVLRGWARWTWDDQNFHDWSIGAYRCSKACGWAEFDWAHEDATLCPCGQVARRWFDGTVDPFPLTTLAGHVFEDISHRSACLLASMALTWRIEGEDTATPTVVLEPRPAFWAVSYPAQAGAIGHAALSALAQSHNVSVRMENAR